MLDTLDRWIDGIPPLPTPQRFGNVAFRTWGKRLEDVRVLPFYLRRTLTYPCAGNSWLIASTPSIRPASVYPVSDSLSSFILRILHANGLWDGT